MAREPFEPGPSGSHWLDHEQRLIRLETLFENVATRADIAELKSDLKGEMLKLVIGLVVAQTAIVVAAVKWL